jgi:translation initiation factor RLI1
LFGLVSRVGCHPLQVIRDLLTPKTYVIVVEHDLAVLDYLSDFICCLYGKPGAYGVVTMPFSVRDGINIFLAGFVPTENLRFRDEALTFKVCRGFQHQGLGSLAMLCRHMHSGACHANAIHVCLLLL